MFYTTPMRHYGWKPDKFDSRDHTFHYSLGAPLPDIIDLRAAQPSIYDQGQLGSCTGNGIARCIQTARRKQGLEDWTPSRLLIYLMERMKEGTIMQDAGASIRDGIKAVAKLGSCRESLWPYDITKFSDMPGQSVFVEAKLHPSPVYASVPQNSLAVRSCLAAGFPVVFGCTVYSSFEGEDVAKTGNVPLPKPRHEYEAGGHCMVIVGAKHADRQFIVANSWGEGWGDKGYCYMPYEYLMTRLASDFWQIDLVK